MIDCLSLVQRCSIMFSPHHISFFLNFQSVRHSLDDELGARRKVDERMIGEHTRVKKNADDRLIVPISMHMSVHIVTHVFFINSRLNKS